MKLTPIVSMSISNSPAAGAGGGISSTRMTSGPPVSWTRIDFIRSLVSLGMTLTASFEHCLGDRLQLHVGRALVDGADLRVAIKLFGGIVLGVAVRAKELQR